MPVIYQPIKTPAYRSIVPLIEESSEIINCFAGEWTAIGRNNKLIESSIGDYPYTMEDVTINYSEIGKFCSIASHVCINPVQHPMDRVSQHHITYRRLQYQLKENNDEAFFDWRRSHKVKIGHDVWIGHGAIIMKGVEIGNGAVVGAGAVVTKNVEPYSIVAGVPATPIRKRFSDEIAAKLEEVSWWDWPREKLENHLDDLNDVELFIKKHG